MTLEDFLSEWNNGEQQLRLVTSGSTGHPKTIWVEKRRMVNSARITCDFLGLKPGDTALLCMSLDYVAGKMMAVRSWQRQLQLICVHPSGHPLSAASLNTAQLRSFDPDAELCLTNEITFAAMVPMQVYNSLQVPEERERLSRVKHLIIGGGAIDDALTEQLRGMSEEFRQSHGYENAIWSTYGMTETLSHIALRRINGKEASEWYQPFRGVKISQTEEGCLVIDAPQVCAEPLVTNDIAEVRGQRFRIKGRKDNVICSGGIKIQIEEVEALLRPHLEKPFMMVKKKDQKFGEIAVLMTEDHDVQKVEATVRRLLSETSEEEENSAQRKYWIPREFMYVEHLPLTETGKPRRWLLSNEQC